MPQVIAATNLVDPPDFDEFVLEAELVGGFIQITENPAEVELVYGRYGALQKLPPMILPVGSYNVGRSPNGMPLSGIRARNATAGVVSQLAGYFWSVADPTLAFVGVPQGAGGGVNSVRVRRSTNQTILAGTLTAIVFDLETFDNGDMWDAGQPSRLTVPAGGDGKYLVGGHGITNPTNIGDLLPRIRLNGVTYVGIGGANAGSGSGLGVVTLWDAIAGDYFELIIQNTVGLNRDMVAAADYSTVAYATRLP